MNKRLPAINASSILEPNSLAIRRISSLDFVVRNFRYSFLLHQVQSSPSSKSRRGLETARPKEKNKPKSSYTDAMTFKIPLPTSRIAKDLRIISYLSARLKLVCNRIVLLRHGTRSTQDHVIWPVHNSTQLESPYVLLSLYLRF